MRLQPADGGVEILFDSEEAGMLDQLVRQLIMLMESHSTTALDPDPLFASLEVGGSDVAPDDPALARLFPDAFEDAADATAFRRVTEQGLINRKLQDAMQVIGDLDWSLPNSTSMTETAVNITEASFPAWARTVTAVRLAIAARIGLESEEDHERLIDEEQTRGTVLVFDWLASLLDAILALGAASKNEGATGL
ncbi:DUF2017 family protein [Leucobacter denitrificans]|uniref:DUF2017 family protein n=1 Tax=Leucobacter denitrificans TaxID=683042 RepID=A0A7G9S507_9MICO|nr:DUF2017 family protein [Leucobacter denitrificans]QNN62932.1 DUF2017 family protein [Leucobacter denitrificans]